MIDPTIENEIIIVQGIKGFGKTNSIKCMIQSKPKVFVIDIRNEYKHLKHYYRFQEFIMAVMSNGTFNGDFKVAFTFHSKSEYTKLFYFLQSIRNCVLIIDEADTLFQIREFNNPLFNLFLGSRNNQVDLILLSKRPFLLPPSIRSQADKFIIFRIEEEQDIRYLEKRIRTELPKSPTQLVKGECLISDRDKKMKLYHFEKFDSNKNYSEEI